VISQGVLKGKDKVDHLAFRRIRLRRKKGFRVRARFRECNALFKGQMCLEYKYGENSHWHCVDLSPSEARMIIKALQARLNELDSLDVYNSSIIEK